MELPATPASTATTSTLPATVVVPSAAQASEPQASAVDQR